VTLLESLGTHTLVSVADDEGVRFRVAVPEGEEPSVGDRLAATTGPDRAFLYRRADGELVGADSL
jgi:hypothetical protein